MFSTRTYDRASFRSAGGDQHDFRFVEARLTPDTVPLAEGCAAVCVFVNDDVGAMSLERLAAGGVRHVALRSAGYNHVDLAAARQLGLSVVRVPAYSPNAVAEHTIALTVGVVGTGKIGALVARLLWHFRCRVLASDPTIDESLVDLGVSYVSLDELWPQCDIISLNAPLLDSTYHLVDARVIARCKRGFMLVNTGRGPLIDTVAVIDALKSGQIGSLALDVYEEEGALFFEDRSGDILDDDVFARLLTFPNVLITAHQAFLTKEALAAIAEVTIANLDDLEAGRPCANAVM
jgi:D-lactate dehydrogenase